MKDVEEGVKEDFDVIKSIFDDFNVSFGIIFGSSVTGSFREESDIDIAVWFNGKTDSMSVVSLENRLEEKIGRDFDIVDLERVSGEFAYRIFKEGKVFYDPKDVKDNIKDSVVVDVSDEEIEERIKETKRRLSDLGI